MKVLVIGAHGKVGHKVVDKLAKHQHEVVAMLRKKDQINTFEKDHVQPVLADLEGDIAPAFDLNPDVVIFSAGSGAHTPKEKTHAVDLEGAKKAMDASVKHKVKHFVMVSAMGANRIDDMPDEMYHYYVAKSEADQYLVQSALDYTILRPGRLSDEAGDGNVQAAFNIENPTHSSVSRDDVANAIVHMVEHGNEHNKQVIELLNGSTPLNKAFAAL